MKSYTILNAMAPESFLSPDTFATDLDTPELNARQYAKGLEIGQGASEVFISANGTWGACIRERGSLLSSYEGIGYHSGTAALLRGILDSGAKVVVYRYGGPEKGTTIQAGPPK